MSPIPASLSRRTSARSLASALVVPLLCALPAGCAPDAPAGEAEAAGAGAATAGGTVTAFTGARLWDGTGSPPMEGATLLVRDGRVAAVGPAGQVEIPAGAATVDLGGQTVIPGLINAHGHIGQSRGLEAGPDVYTRANILDQLSLNARYGVTTVVSLGGDGPAGVGVRDEQDAGLDRARLLVAGPIPTPGTAEEARAAVAEIAAMGADWVKIRVDDNLDQSEKMAPEVYGALAEAAAGHGLPLAVHIVDLEDAKGVVRAGAALVAHSVRDAPVDDELIRLMRESGACYSPTLAREVSVFTYGSRPDFFDDPFFDREADPAILATLMEPERQARVRESASARFFQAALPLAQANLKALADGGVTIAMGTDSGPPARFQGYFEHMELELMAEAGLTPEQILLASTRDAARCMELDDVGTLEVGKWADFVVLSADPLADVAGSRSLTSVWIAGNRVPGTGQ